MGPAVATLKYLFFSALFSVIVFVAILCVVNYVYGGVPFKLLPILKGERIIRLSREFGIRKLVAIRSTVHSDFAIETPATVINLQGTYFSIARLTTIFPICDILDAIIIASPDVDVREVLRLIEILNVIGWETLVTIVVNDIRIVPFHKIIRKLYTTTNWTVREVIHIIGYINLMNILVFRIGPIRVALIKKLIGDPRFSTMSLRKPWPVTVFSLQRDMDNWNRLHNKF